MSPERGAPGETLSPRPPCPPTAGGWYRGMSVGEAGARPRTPHQPGLRFGLSARPGCATPGHRDAHGAAPTPAPTGCRWGLRHLCGRQRPRGEISFLCRATELRGSHLKKAGIAGALAKSAPGGRQVGTAVPGDTPELLRRPPLTRGSPSSGSD